jgi:hypothetical protein
MTDLDRLILVGPFIVIGVYFGGMALLHVPFYGNPLYLTPLLILLMLFLMCMIVYAIWLAWRDR